MAERFSRLRIVRPSDPFPPRRPRRPGAAVVLILVYAAVFGAGLWWFKSASPLFKNGARRSGKAPGAAAAPAPPRDALARRAALLAGEGLSPAAQKVYVRRIAAERCTCGCELTVQACLARDRTCSRSPGMAEKIQDSLR